MNLDKKGGVSGFIMMIVFLFIGIMAFVLFIPIALPFIDTVGVSGASPMIKFLMLGIPIFTIISLIVGTVMS